jgi:hypothetical protein
MDWEDQLSPAMVAEMRTVDGSRHDFVNRQNEIILEYRAKAGAAVAPGQLKTGLNILICDADGSNCRPYASGAYTSPAFVSGPDYFSTVTLKVVDIPAGCQSLTCANDLSAAAISWSVPSVDNSTLGAVWKRTDGGAKNGLTWGNTADGTSLWAADAVADTASTTDTAN